MTDQFKFGTAIIVAALALYLWSAFRSDSSLPATTQPLVATKTSPPPSALPDNHLPSETTIDPTNTDPRFTRFKDGRIHFNPSLAKSRKLHRSENPRDDLDIITQLLSDYRLVYQENPVGIENGEIIEQLLGKNPKHITFIDPGITALNSNRELLDRWGSPYIFHSLKADLMDIRSLGPDRKPWTKDDHSLDLEAVEEELGLKPDPVPN